ncbi:MAG TPA: hypothetical protein VFA55_02285, partial [Candidatus Kapabacteria bacterium]|nr:hypothetical protein [Candidatus Kapabacteria bacterium]
MMRNIYSLVLAGCTLALFLCFASHPQRSNKNGNKQTDADEPASAAAINFFYDQRAYPRDNFSAEHYIAEYRRVQTMRAQESATATTSWRSLGPTNVPGRVLAVAMSPSDTTQVWVGTASGGLWRLTDKGDSNYSWQPIETGFPALSVNTIYIDSSVNPAFPNIVFIGTGEVYSYRNAMPSIGLRTSRGLYGIGILYSTDNGVTWNQSLTFPDSGITGVNKIIANPRFPRSMYAATTEGIYKSYDLGQTWVLKLPQLMVTDIVINRVDTTTLFAACGDQGGLTTGIFRSTDAGEHWSPVTSGLPAHFTGRASLAIDRPDPKLIFAGITDEFSPQGLYRSSDNGDTWKLVSDTDYCGLQGWYANVVVINPFFFDNIYCGGIYLWSSQVNGFNLQRNENQIHVDIHAIDFSPFNSNTFYVGTDGGVYKTTDGGLSFADRNTGLVTTQFYNRFSNAADDSSLALGGTQDNGTLLYTGSGTWKTVLGGDGSWPIISSDNHDTMFVQFEDLTTQRPVNAGAHFYRSTDGGNTISTIFLGDTLSNDASAFTTPIVQAPSDPSTMFIGTSKIYKSTNNGLQWSVMNNGQDVDAQGPGANPFVSLAVSRNSTDTIYGVTTPVAIRSGVFISTDGGSSWKNITDTLPNRFPTDVAIDPVNAATAYVTFSGFGGKHIFKTTNAGASWGDITGI